MKKMRNYFNQFIAFFSMIIFFAACSPAIKNQESTTTQLRSPTSTITPLPSVTSIPHYTNVPNHYDQNDASAEFISLILIKDTNNMSREDILTKLVVLLLEYYKTKSQIPRAIIKDYKDVYVNKVINDNNNNDGFFDIVASVKFSIIPAQYPTDWASLVIDPITSIDPWWHLGEVFGFFRDGEYFRLRSMPGWGT